MSDELRKRLARLDPMGPGVPTEPTTTESSRQMMEMIMSTPIKEAEQTQPAPKHPWFYGVAAAAALVFAVGGGLLLTGGDGDPVASGPPLELNAGGEDITQMCIAFSPEELEKVAEIAFAGTVTAVNGNDVTLTVDDWYRGGDAAEVALNAPQGMEALIGGIPFEVGAQYLITAQDGNVNYCGFSGPATPEYAAAFEEAFAQG
ncbi:MAG TPA: hypothetical protein VG872_13380 [Acidimicrobiia bacterium]|jgi:hypothetical protein|nr:hypothetical protein [Acidimicrobiia bacterium]